MEGIYKSLLWFLGFPEGQTISELLARQKQRLGKWWWLFPIGTIIVCLGLFITSIWLTFHVATFKIEETK